MKVTVMQPVEIDIKTIKVALPVRYGDESMPFDFPLRTGDVWEAVIDVETGTIIGWPQGKSGTVDLKVVDEGVYELYDNEGKAAKSLSGYVPHGVIPGEYGDYVLLDIDETGKITNWESPTFEDFFTIQEED